MTAAEAAPRILAALQGGDPIVEVVVVDGPLAGERLLVGSGTVTGSLGAAALYAAAVEAGRAALDDARPRAETVELEGVRHTLYLEPHQPAGELVIVGAGHIAQPLSRLGASLGFRVVVMDDRPEFATRERFPEADRVVGADFSRPFEAVPVTSRTHLVLVTRGHRYDYQALREVLRMDVRPAYIGMVGSRRRVRAAFEQLARDGIPAARLEEVRAPIGLDIGAETPEEIAVSIAAELVLARRGGSGAPLAERERVVGRLVRTDERRTEPVTLGDHGAADPGGFSGGHP